MTSCREVYDTYLLACNICKKPYFAMLLQPFTITKIQNFFPYSFYTNTCQRMNFLIISKNSKPRCFKGVKSLPLEYTSNKKAWLTSAPFESWLRKFDRKFPLQGRTIAMVVDNCPVDNLRAIKLIFLSLPTNVTSILQPCDQGIICSFKRHYRTAVLQRYLTHITHNQDGSFVISILDALYLMRRSWESVTESCIANCFRHAGFKPANANTDTTIDVPVTSAESIELASANGESRDPEPSDNLGNLFERLSDLVSVTTSLDSYLSVDQDLPVAEERTRSLRLQQQSGKETVEKPATTKTQRKMRLTITLLNQQHQGRLQQP